MRLTQNTTIHLLLGAAVLPGIALLYLVLAHPGQAGLPPTARAVWGGVALALVLVAFGPSLVRRWRRLPPPQPLSASDIRFCLALTLIACALAFFGTFIGSALGVPWLGPMAILIAPLAFMFRFRGRQ